VELSLFFFNPPGKIHFRERLKKFFCGFYNAHFAAVPPPPPPFTVQVERGYSCKDYLDPK